MSLNETQRHVFYNLVRDHIRTKKPIGSKILAKKLKIFSPPTLRFHFRKLVKKGYLRNSKNFTGREPTEKGWHYYLESYELKPEIKITFKNSLEEFLENVAWLTENIVFFRKRDSDQFIFKGLKKVLSSFNDKDFLFDIGELIENLEKIVATIENDKILIGREIKESKSGSLSLIIKKTKDFEIGFLGHKINFYHTLFLVFRDLNGRK